MKLFIYNFNGIIYETITAFDETYKKLKAECLENGEPMSRQIVDGEKILNETYHSAGIWY